MDNLKLKILNQLQKDIEQTEGKIESLSNYRKQPGHWVSLSFGNGSSKATILHEEDRDTAILDLIEVTLLRKLETLKHEFKEL